MRNVKCSIVGPRLPSARTATRSSQDGYSSIKTSKRPDPMDVLVLDMPAEQMGWLLAFIAAIIFLLIVAIIAFWFLR